MATTGPIHATTTTFEQEILASDTPVIVDFWAPWCGPCRMQKPVMEKLAGELAGRAKVAFVNVDEEPQLAEKFGVQSIPALMIVNAGQIVDAFLGYTPREKVIERLARATQRA